MRDTSVPFVDLLKPKNRWVRTYETNTPGMGTTHSCHRYSYGADRSGRFDYSGCCPLDSNGATAMTKSFSQRLRAGESPDELKKYYCLSNDQYQRIIASLQEIRKNGGE